MSRRDMAHRSIPLAILPDARLILEDDINVTPRERLRLLLGYAIGTLVVLGFVVAMSLAGPA